MAKSVLVLTVLILLLNPPTNIHIKAIEPGCENCGCCVNMVCATEYTQGRNVTEFCTKGCVIGIGGSKCYNKCPDDCLTCEQENLKNCATCDVGKYLNSSKRCVECPSQCATCTSDTQCHECHSPYYNEGGVTDCSLVCKGNCKCSSPEACSSCKDGFFNTDNECNSICPVNCRTCSDLNVCHTCKSGFYNGKVNDHPDAVEVSDCSLACRDNCLNCSSYNKCNVCKEGRYGNDCEKFCSVGCTNNECSIDGSCVCRSNFVGPYCTDCIPGMFGDVCESPCPFNCLNEACDKRTGECTSCVSGYYGQLCGNTCPSGCLSSDCDFKTGACRGCKSSFSGDKCCLQGGNCLTCSSNNECSTCARGYYGVVCNLSCPNNCPNVSIESQCDRDTGVCKSCDDGVHGDYCNKSCSDQCLNQRCVQNSGYCSDGCSGRFDGPTCSHAMASDEPVDTVAAVGASMGVVIVILVILLVAQYFVLRKRFTRDHFTNLMKTKQECNTSPHPVGSSLNDRTSGYETVHNEPNESVYNVLAEDGEGTVSAHGDSAQYMNTRIDLPL